MWHVITRLTDQLSRLMAYLAGGAILCIALMQILELVLRNAFNTSLPFVWEYASYLHMGAVFLAAAYTLRVGGHIRVTMLQSIQPRVFECLATTVGLCISAFLSVALVKFAWVFGVTGRTSGTVNDIPLVYPAAFVAFGSVMLTLQLILRLVNAAMGQSVEVATKTASTSLSGHA